MCRTPVRAEGNHIDDSAPERPREVPTLTRTDVRPPVARCSPGAAVSSPVAPSVSARPVGPRSSDDRAERVGVQVLMLVATPVANDTRVLREATALVGAGHAVHVVGLGVPPGFVPPHGVTVSSAGRRPRTSRTATPGAPSRCGATVPARPGGAPPAGSCCPSTAQRVFGGWAREAYADAARRTFDVVHAHDFNTLVLGDRLAREHHVPLVYDSHELWFGRPVVGRPTPLRDARGRRTEARLGGRAGRRGHRRGRGRGGARGGLRVARRPRRPEHLRGPATAVRAARTDPASSTPGGWPRTASSRSSPLPAGTSRCPSTSSGPADETWLRDFDPAAARVLDAVPAEEVSWLLRGAGVALVTHSDRWPNHRLAMPNKLFQAVAAGVPVVATDVGELATLVRGYRLGTLYRPGDPASLATAVHELLASYDRYAQPSASRRRRSPGRPTSGCCSTSTPACRPDRTTSPGAACHDRSRPDDPHRTAARSDRRQPRRR